MELCEASKQSLPELLEQLRLIYGGDAAKAEREFMAPVCREVIAIANERQTKCRLSAAATMDLVLERIGYKLPKFEARRTLGIATILYAAAVGALGAKAGVYIPENN